MSIVWQILILKKCQFGLHSYYMKYLHSYVIPCVFLNITNKSMTKTFLLIQSK
ncbi:unnamed protein product [Schistosoma curassoni]|uniref:Uncharacterized protein n=1 Tax=Schistosoma curassoni TaxID=6186 RepID=A0A183K5K6_9TREM|nr:unnamed protein product [Schistosoma curassoni]